MVPKFILKSLPQKETLGQKLSRKRRSMGVEIPEVEKITRIRAKYIHSLERGNYDALPADIYIRGFLKNYAQFLGLDYSRLLEIYKKERGIEEKVKKATGKAPVVKPIKVPKVVITPKTIIIGLVVSSILAVVFYIGWQFRVFSAPPKLQISSPADNSALDTDYTFIVGKTDPGAKLFFNDSSVATDPDGSFKERISLQEGTNLLKIVAANEMGKETALSLTLLVKTEESLTSLSPSPSPLPSPIITSGVELKVEIGPKAAWLYVLVDGKEEFQGTVVAGVAKVFKASESIEITSGNPTSTHLYLSNEKVVNKDLGMMNKTGKVETKKFEKDTNVP